MMKKALSIIGDFYHSQFPLYNIIQPWLTEKGYAVLHIADYEIPFDHLDEYELIILSRYGRHDGLFYRTNESAPDRAADGVEIETPWLSPEQGELLENYILAGGKILMHHDSFALCSRESVQCKLAKAFFKGHPPIGTYSMQPIGKETPLNAGIEEFEVCDEEYQLELDESQTAVFAASWSKANGRCVQGWHHAYGKGRVVVFVPGHNQEVLTHPHIKQYFENMFSFLTQGS